MNDHHPIVLFDGVCRFCDASVHFLIDRDRRARLRFAPLQSPVGQGLLRRFGYPPDYTSSLLLVDGGRCWSRSTAGLRIARHLGGAWPALLLLLAVPAPLRDAVYDLIARNRYRWFGQMEECRVPTPELRARFVG